MIFDISSPLQHQLARGPGGGLQSSSFLSIHRRCVHLDYKMCCGLNDVQQQRADPTDVADERQDGAERGDERGSSPVDNENIRDHHAPLDCHPKTLLCVPGEEVPQCYCASTMLLFPPGSFLPPGLFAATLPPTQHLPRRVFDTDGPTGSSIVARWRRTRDPSVHE